jgi:hypothetical protein
LKGDCGKDRILDQPSFEKIKIGSSVLFIFTKLTTQSLCSVSIVKRGHLLLPIFGFLHKKIQKNTYKKIINNNNNIVGRNPKIIGVREGWWNAHKMARNWLRRFKNTRIEI